MIKTKIDKEFFVLVKLAQIEAEEHEFKVAYINLTEKTYKEVNEYLAGKIGHGAKLYNQIRVKTILDIPVVVNNEYPDQIVVVRKLDENGDKTD